MSEGWSLADWDNYWTSTTPSREVVTAQGRWVRRITGFARKMNLELDAVADIGCGPAIALFELARKFPEINFYGFDGSSVAIRKNTDRARRRSIRNIVFSHIQLPNVPRRTSFDLVLCIATLHYIKDSLPAIQGLYSIVRPGGFLIFNYPNRYTRYWYQSNADEGMKRRFAVVLAGENILSKVSIEASLGRPCHNFWTEVGETGTTGNPCVFVKKPRTAVSPHERGPLRASSLPERVWETD